MSLEVQELFQRKLSSAQMMMKIGKNIAERVALGETIDVEQIYDEWAELRGSRKPETAALRRFPSYGCSGGSANDTAQAAYRG